MTILTTLALTALLGCAHAHPPSSTATYVSVEWTWVSAHRSHGRLIHAHWYHPEYGHYYRAKRRGPPLKNWSPALPHRSHTDRWVPGHWTGKGFNRHWVEGHWVAVP